MHKSGKIWNTYCQQEHKKIPTGLTASPDIIHKSQDVSDGNLTNSKIQKNKLLLFRRKDIKMKRLPKYTPAEVRNDPYGFTYKEMSEVIGENEAKALYEELYKQLPRKKNLSCW